MAKSSGMMIALLVAGAGGLLLLSGSKAKASAASAEPAKLPSEKKTPVHVDADKPGPSAEEIVKRVTESEPVREPPAPAMKPEDFYDAPEPTLPIQSTSVPPVPDVAPEEERFVPTSLTARPAAGGVWRVTNEDGSPVTPNLAQARKSAQGVADNIRGRGTAYDRPKLATWQAIAGLRSVDGVYGPESQGALTKFGAKQVPRPLFKGAK